MVVALPRVQRGGASAANGVRLALCLRPQAAEGLWAENLGGAAAAPAPRFTVPDLNKVPSMQAIEAESMRAAAAEAFGFSGGGAPAADAADASLGMPPLPSGMLGGAGGAGGADDLGALCGADLLAGLRLDGSSEPPVSLR